MLRNKQRIIDLAARKFKLFSFNIGSLTPANKKLYIVTLEGDVVEVVVKPKKDSANAQSAQVIYKKKRIHYNLSGI